MATEEHVLMYELSIEKRLEVVPDFGELLKIELIRVGAKDEVSHHSRSAVQIGGEILKLECAFLE